MIAVTGITGHSGTFFLQELIKNNYLGLIRCLVRTTSNTKNLDKSGLKIEKVVGSLDDEESILRLVDGADTLIHITNIRFSLRLVDAAKKAKVRRVILVHTTGVYSKYKMASNEYKEIEAELEHYFNDSMDITVVRPTMIFGDLCDHNISKFIKMVDRFPIMPVINHGSCLLQPVNAHDLGKAYYQLMQYNNLPEVYYDVTGEREVSMLELFQLIGEYLGKSVKFISVPLSLGVLGARIIKIITFKKIDYIERVLRMGENRNYDHNNATRDFNYTPENFNDGLKREVLSYIESKELKNEQK